MDFLICRKLAEPDIQVGKRNALCIGLGPLVPLLAQPGIQDRICVVLIHIEIRNI